MDKDAYISFFFPTVLPINHCPVVSHSPQFLAFLFVIWCQLMTLLSPIDILHLWLLLYNYTVTFHENYSTFTTVAYLEQTEPWKQCLHISHAYWLFGHFFFFWRDDRARIRLQDSWWFCPRVSPSLPFCKAPLRMMLAPK